MKKKSNKLCSRRSNVGDDRVAALAFIKTILVVDSIFATQCTEAVLVVVCSSLQGFYVTLGSMRSGSQTVSNTGWFIFTVDVTIAEAIIVGAFHDSKCAGHSQKQGE